MDHVFFQPKLCLGRFVTACFGVILAGIAAHADPQHGIAMYGAPKLTEDFTHLPYANPGAPKGGKIILANTGSFDSLNPYIRKGNVPWQLRFLTHESLMARNWDEPFGLYGLLAESVETDPERVWVEFTLRAEARFSDGAPVTVEDVLWSFETLGSEGHPRYRSLWDKIARAEKTGPRSVRFTFAEANRELALLAGLRPILQKSQWEGKEFAKAHLADIPIGSGPYMVADYEAGRQVTLARNPGYWGRDLPIRAGTHNFDQIKIDFYGDGTVLREAFRAGEISAVREFNAENWLTQYDFPAVARGDIVKSELRHQKPSGFTGFAINTRRPGLSDWRVREALIQAFNFEYINETLTGGQQPRITSYFSGSPLAFEPGPAVGAVADLLAPYRGALPPGTLEGYSFPQSDGRLRNRKGLRRAMKLLQEAGFTVKEGVLLDPKGDAFSLTLLLPNSNPEHQTIADLYAPALQNLGIDLQIERVDQAQFTERSAAFEFDLISFRRSVSLSPGNEQSFYWGSAAAAQTGSRNLPGISSDAVDAMIKAMLGAQSTEEFTAATRALDRTLTAGRYIIPFYRYDVDRIAHVRQIQHPKHIPIYGDGPEYMPQLWWWQE